MKMKLLWLLLAFASITQAAAPDTSQSGVPLLQPLPQESKAAHLSAEVLTRYHYKAAPLDDTMSSQIFDRYLKSLDPEKMFFVQSDIDQISSEKTKLGDAINNENLSPAFKIFNLYEQRFNERFTYARSLLKQGFDFTAKENFQASREKESWIKSEDEMRDLWRKRVKNDWLRLKLAGKDPKSIVNTLDKRYDNYLVRNRKLKSDDAFQIFMNAYAESTDPHTNYFGVRASEDFDISMRLSLIGIGAVLVEHDEYTTIRELVAGGPAMLSGKLKVGDRIVGVAQGEHAPMVEVLGWRLDDTVAIIRGAGDSTVVLDILPEDAGPDGKHKLVSLIRKKINLEQQAAKDSIIEVKDGANTRHIGVISLPTFYQDFAAHQRGDPDFKSATRDVSHLLAQLKKDKVDSVLIDLRNNGGGSLDEAIELTGLFINKGPVVQQRNASGKIEVESYTKGKPVWDGPLGVMINRGSASASEIFAAAIQDYGRGVVIGESSFGKGTVQRIVDLDEAAHNDKPKYGELKMTTAQFFRINGGTTQLRGVTPDISFPSSIDSDEFGESSYDNALPWTQINAADYALAGDLSDVVPLLQARHDSRIKNDKEYQYLEEDIALFKAERKKNSISLNEADRRKERDTQEARIKAHEKATESSKSASEKLAAAKSDAIRDDGLQANERTLTVEIAAEKAAKDAKDVLLNEAVHILSDEVDLLKTDSRLAARVLPGLVLSAGAKSN
ncbi:MAG TPA: carboxy terminal-processing peptidase [Burkholderiaceae bacterium]|nr:carboxy terminal-processing peptidase [Burkholderiaceae bacterium]